MVTYKPNPNPHLPSPSPNPYSRWSSALTPRCRCSPAVPPQCRLSTTSTLRPSSPATSAQCPSLPATSIYVAPHHRRSLATLVPRALHRRLPRCRAPSLSRLIDHHWSLTTPIIAIKLSSSLLPYPVTNSNRKTLIWTKETCWSLDVASIDTC